MPWISQVKSRWALPNIVHPTTYRKFVVCVPNERFYIAAFRGLLIELTYSKNWQRDDAHTAAEVARVWQHAIEDVLCDDCQEIIVTGESEYIMSICEQLRFQNGKLQGFCCGEWVDIDGQGNTGDEGAPQPEPNGGCVSYTRQLFANAQDVLPTVVNAGDTVNVSSITGAGSDGTLAWTCPDGRAFFAGLCGGLRAPDGADPEPTLPHMQVLVKIDSVYYPATGGLITVPGGIVNEQVILQVNDSSLPGNGGDYHYVVEVCNNQATQFTHHFDFRLNPWGFVADLKGGDSDAQWIAGVGWKSTSYNPIVAGRGALEIALNSSAPLVNCRLRVVGTSDDGTNGQYVFEQTAAMPPTAVGEIYSSHDTGAFDLSHDFTATLTRFGYANNGGPNPGQEFIITDGYVTADGIDPF